MKIFFSIIIVGILLSSCGGKKIDIEGSVKEKEQLKGHVVVSYKKLAEKEKENIYRYYYEAEIDSAGKTTLIQDSIVFHTTGDNIWTPNDF